MHTLILNWRDIKNPSAGGAEILTHEIAKRWVKLGYKVTQFSSMFESGKKEELIDGVTIKRQGQWWNTHLYAFFYYVKHFKQIDVVIDEVHWFPYFSILYAPRKTILLVCEVAHPLFAHLFSESIASFWRMVEKLYLFMYRQTPTLAISDSTKKDLIRHGFSESAITVLPMGMTKPAINIVYEKEKTPTLVFLGRLTKVKGIEDALQSLKLLLKKFPTISLWVIGNGTDAYKKFLTHKIKEYNISSSVHFFGFVDQEKKYELLSKSHILVVPSVHEGWGLVVDEAGFCKTPAVVYNVLGLRDTVIHQKSGLICKTTPQDLATSVEELLSNPQKYKELQENSKSKADKADWDITAREALHVIKQHV